MYICVCVCVCVCVYIYIYIYTHTNTHIHTYTHLLKIICVPCKYYTCVHPHTNFILQFSFNLLIYRTILGTTTTMMTMMITKTKQTGSCALLKNARSLTQQVRFHFTMVHASGIPYSIVTYSWKPYYVLLCHSLSITISIG